MSDWGKFNIPDGIKGYESPISLNFVEGLIKQIQENQELQIMQQVKTVVDVDKEELIKALDYDRDQYKQGYEKGYEEGYKRAVRDNQMIASAWQFPEVTEDAKNRWRQAQRAIDAEGNGNEAD